MPPAGYTLAHTSVPVLVWFSSSTSVHALIDIDYSGIYFGRKLVVNVSNGRFANGLCNNPTNTPCTIWVRDVSKRPCQNLAVDK